MNFFSIIVFCLFFFVNQCFSNPIDYILVSKSERKLSIFEGHNVIKNFNISLGFEPIGRKTKQGDGKTPEGLYYVEKKISNSAFFLALKISYPNPWDIRQALTIGDHPGGQIMIHGQPNKNYDKYYHNSNNDWTEGCVAVSNIEMRYLWKRIKVGTPILIKK